jgi:hypothetical protein
VKGEKLNAELVMGESQKTEVRQQTTEKPEA